MAYILGQVVVGKLCETVVEMVVQKLTEEANLVVNFRKEFIWLSQELQSIRGLLQDADQQSHHREDVKQWVENIRDIAMRAEDIFEECAVRSMYGNNAQSCGLSCSELSFRCRIGRQIKDIKDRMGSTIQKANQLVLIRKVLSEDGALPSTSQIQDLEWKRSTLLPSDSHPVGIQAKVADMLNLLGNPASTIIAVVGMGGMGKTYLLQHVYSQTKENYEKSIWLSVSQSYSIANLQKDLVFQLDRHLSEEIGNAGVSEQVLAPLIHEKLRGISCLVVLDDVWRASRLENFLSRLGLPSGNNSQCKIVVTTRNKMVCTNLNAQMYEMQHMSDEDSWRLFCVYAFGGFEENIEPQQQLKEVGWRIVKQCGNLPLAIKTIAASLANSIDLNIWELKLHQLEQVIIYTDDNDRIMDILKLSYDCLPARLKACFAYLSFFPEDEEIDPEYLINLWIGEGFIPAGMNQLDAAWNCLHQLANLCLLQLWEEGNGSELTKHCKIHDLLLDLAVHISKENKCSFSVEEASTNTSDSTGWCRILLAKKDINDNAISDSPPICLRTLSLSQNKRITSTPASLFTAMRGLRVLDLSGTEISTLPASLGKMKLLRLLNLKETYIEEVLDCIKHLKSLLFLALPNRHYSLPGWISELQCQQHLECKGIYRMPKGISKLLSLRTLRTEKLRLSTQEDECMRLEDLANMTRLQELSLIVRHEMELRKMNEGVLQNLVMMRRLVLTNQIDTAFPQIPDNMTSMKRLESLHLEKFQVPSWICGLVNLRELQLKSCDCSDYPELQRLPNLVMLVLYGNSRCRKFPEAFGRSGGFTHLRFFKNFGFSELEEFPELEKGAMACLEVLELRTCQKVKKMGEGLELLRKLKELYCASCERNKWWETLEKGGEYWEKIKATNLEVAIRIDNR